MQSFYRIETTHRANTRECQPGQAMPPNNNNNTEDHLCMGLCDELDELMEFLDKFGKTYVEVQRGDKLYDESIFSRTPQMQLRRTDVVHLPYSRTIIPECPLISHDNYEIEWYPGIVVKEADASLSLEEHVMPMGSSESLVRFGFDFECGLPYKVFRNASSERVYYTLTNHTLNPGYNPCCYHKNKYVVDYDEFPLSGYTRAMEDHFETFTITGCTFSHVNRWTNKVERVNAQITYDGYGNRVGVHHYSPTLNHTMMVSESWRAKNVEGEWFHSFFNCLLNGEEYQNSRETPQFFRGVIASIFTLFGGGSLNVPDDLSQDARESTAAVKGLGDGTLLGAFRWVYKNWATLRDSPILKHMSCLL
jgi:hypothetical protein